MGNPPGPGDLLERFLIFYGFPDGIQENLYLIYWVNLRLNTLRLWVYVFCSKSPQDR